MQPTLTETRIEIADRHTTLFFLEDPPASGPLGTVDYSKLYGSVLNSAGAGSGLIPTTEPKPLLKKLFPVCQQSNWRFWREYLDGVDFYPGLALREGIPIRATINPFLQLDLPAGFSAKVVPEIYVLLYPFGWSTWTSLRVTKDHSIDDLALLLHHIFQSKAWLLDTQPDPMTLDDLFDHIADHLRNELFSGSQTRDRAARDRIVMTTVLSKNGSAYSYKSLSANQQDQLKALVTPKGPLAKKPLSESIYTLVERRPEVNYLVSNNLARFLWMEDMLTQEGRQRQHLHCYHNNNFISLAQAWHLEGLLNSAASLQHRSAALNQIVDTAIERLTYPRRKNASLIAFLESRDVTDILARFAKRIP